MTKLNICILLLFNLLYFQAYNQVSYTANDTVPEYDGFFGYGTNVGYFPKWSAMALGDLAMGNRWLNLPGVGATTMRPALTEVFQEEWGYKYRINTFEKYKLLGAVDNVVFVGYPSPEHKDTTYYCPDHPSELFANMYLPIWDNGENGTPYNDDNYYAAYMYRTVDIYKEYVKFWEVWNEPDFSFTASSIHSEGIDGNWWENNPDPCSYALRAPIFHYIRLLRISYEVIKTVDPEAFVAVGGIGYPSFLDAILRNTDNPVDGSAAADFPLMGGAYFDVLSYHTYPHLDNSLRVWSNEKGDFVYRRHTDAAVRGLINLKNRFERVLFKHKYNGFEFPQKEWIITESNVPRKPLNKEFGSDEIQRNFIIKALVEVQKHDMLQFHVYTLGDRGSYEEVDSIYQEFNLMGMYSNLFDVFPFQQKTNDLGIAYKTTSDLLYRKQINEQAFKDLRLPDGVKGGVFTNLTDRPIYVLWSETFIDQSEESKKEINLRNTTGFQRLEQLGWDFSRTKRVNMVDASKVELTGAPAFFRPTIEEYYGDPENLNSTIRDGNFMEVSPSVFSEQFQVRFELAEHQEVSLVLHDQYGTRIKEILDAKSLEAGNYLFEVDGIDLQAGIYYLHLHANGVQSIQRVVLAR